MHLRNPENAMSVKMRMRFLIFIALLTTIELLFAQTPPTPAIPATPPIPSPVSGIRNKIAAGDLLSAESILEVHKAKYGADGPWLVGLSWLSRGALLLGDNEKAGSYAAQVRKICAEKISQGTLMAKDHDMEYAFGSAVEVEAQRIERTKNKSEAVDFVRRELEQIKGPVALISRLHKRLNMFTLTGEKAPELKVEDYLGHQPPTLASLSGKPVVLFIWAEGCGDCKNQSDVLGRAYSRYTDKGLRMITLTRYYDEAPDQPREKARIDSVWKAVYAGIGNVPMVISTESMKQYGGSSTPTFVFIDREGIVRRYTPTRLTEEELNREFEKLIH